MSDRSKGRKLAERQSPEDFFNAAIKILAADGPERLFGEWWKSEAERPAVRDYFQVEDDAGERFWLFRAGDGEDSKTGSQAWFLHGIFA